TKVFEPFFTTKPVGKGTGLGLSQVHGFVKQSGGHVWIRSVVGQGTTISLHLPRSSGSGDTAPVKTEDTRALLSGARGETILVVEDEELVRQFSAAALAETGYVVLEASDGPAALGILERYPEVALLFTDVVLAGPMNGRMLADRALALRPALPVLFTSGYARDAFVHHGRLDEGVNFLGKPFTTDALAAKIHHLLGAGGHTD
ncbi:response regulator, partial [Methylobacterium sp. Leaf86]|uniref:response regulator n=1 Tax=Methylobacterium sp. Leaf86 TaxID=1736242 RepID=UPI0012E79795